MNREDFTIRIFLNFLRSVGITVENDILGVVRNVILPQSDIPLCLTGICYEIALHEPGKFYNRKVADELNSKFKTAYDTDSNIFLKGMQSALSYFYTALKSYDYTLELYNEFSESAFDNYFKTNVYRIPTLLRISEDILMNLYRFVRDIHQQYTEKNYSNLETLGQIISVLKSIGYTEFTNVDTDLRNALSHGKAFNHGNSVSYKYKKNGQEYPESINIWDFDRKINESLDIASAGIIGVLRFLSSHVDLLEKLLSIADLEVKDMLIKLQFRSSDFRIMDIQRIGGNKQLNALCILKAKDNTSLLISLYYTAIILYLNYPDFDSYFVSYDHIRSLGGYVRFKKNEIIKFLEDEFSEKVPQLSQKHEINVYEIKEEVKSEREHKYFQFPRIEGEGWYLKYIEDISIESHKRIKAILIVREGRFDKEMVRAFLLESIEKLKRIYTPENPKFVCPYGDSETDAIFIHTFKDSQVRETYSLFNSNKNFLCIANYYRNGTVPRLVHGGIMESLWKEYSREFIDSIEFGWNSNL
ncbi:hypothetical protein [Leptospira saintgironsiae]|uniref:Uncharacterized protein n=1 Tax=Leptospira saintgironsiae TaxID=2023183 RepID=A0A2M9YCD2_9LEPT|nr:hypothetical protein [Leptospira saintgironsiae]PJZ49207.1 hypothetical protein CH362_07640 [Leptospira saintgironsiae]